MGYIKKLKNNELVGGTDKHTIYPVTSTKAVFEEVTEGDKSSFQSQESINTDRLERIETLEAHDENHEGRVSTLEEHDSDHESRVQELERVVPDTIRSISINGGTEHTVDETGNVDLTIYTVNPDDPDVPAMVDLVEKNRDDIADIKEEIGTDTTQDTLSGRITELETLVGGNEQGSVNQRIEDAVGALDVLPGLSSNYDSNEGDDYNVHVGISLEEENGKIKNLNLEAENIAPANKLEELYNYTHNLNETDVVVGAKPAASAALTNTVYRVPSDPDAAHYTDYMKYGTEMVPLATYDIAGEEAQVGCYTGTISGTALSVTAANNANTSISAYALKNGGHFKVKVPSAATNTSGGWTLSMKGLAAKQLLYNGQAVSYTNTWEAGETISVYYDNTGNGAYYASNAQGGSNKKLDAYLYGDLRTLAVGQTYKFDESVKTTDKQFLRITKDITALSMSETLAVGDLKVNSNKTYRVDADKAINVYNPEGDYTENPYALGSLAEYTLTVTAENVVECTITVNDTEVSIDEGEDAVSIATKIVSALGEIEGWTISRNENIITVRCNTIGANTTTITITGTEETGITVDSTLVAGTSVIRKYDGTSWTNAAPADLVTDEVLIEVDAAWLAANAAKQNTVARDLYDIEINFKVGSQNKAINPNAQGASTWYSGYQGKSYFVPIESGAYYMITANATTYVSFLKDNSSRGHGIAVTNFATGETACHRINSRTSVVLKAPFDAKYLLVNYYWYGDITPKSVIKVSLFNVFNKANFVNFDNTTSKLESNNVQDAIVEVLNIADLADKRGVYALTVDDYINNQQVSGSVGDWVYRKYNNAYSISKPMYLHKGDTITKSAFGSGHYTCAFAEWHMNNYRILVTYSMWAAGTTSYTAERDMFVCASGIMSNPGSVTVIRNNSLIDNLANYVYDDYHTDYFYRLFGEIRIPEFTSNFENFIDINNNYAPSGDTWSLYTSPIFLKQGESIFVSFPAGFASGNSLFTLSDAEGNPIGGLSYTTRSGFGKYPTIYMYQAIEDCYVIISGRGRNVLPYIVSDSVLQSYFNRIEGEAKGDIMSLWGTTETLLKLRQLNRPYNSHNSVGVEGPADRVKGSYNPWIIVHFSDIHNDGTNLRRIETFATYYKQQTDHLTTTDVLIDDVLDTGDNVLATAGGGIPWNTSNIAATFLNTIGNHDIENLYNFTFDGVTGWPAVYKKQIGQFRSQWGNVVFPDENVEEEGKCYYYKDYTSQNIRLIVLMNWTNTTAAYLNNEYAWFKDVLDDALSKNLTVVCAGHVKPGNLTPIDGCSFHAYEYGYETQGTANQFVILVDKFIRAGGTFACWLAGHTHYDLTGWINAKYTENGTEYIVDNQLCLVVENAGGQGSDFERRYWNSDNRIAGTKSQDCFNIVCVNAAYYRVSVMRIGSQYDNSGQHKGGFCINYKTKKMLSCY